MAMKFRAPGTTICCEMNPAILADAQTVQRAHRQRFRLLAAVCFLLLGILLGLTAPAVAQAGKRLILKDGSWQAIMQYEVLGDRARYFSTERREWEDVPVDLVDWKATEEWNARPMQIPPDEEETGPDINAIDALTVAPGLELPTSGGVFLLDRNSGEPSLVELNQVPGVMRHNTTGIVHSGISPTVSFMQHLELKRSHARTQAHVPLPSIFVKIAESDQAQPVAPGDRFRIVRLEPKRDSRVLVSVNVTVIGKQSQVQQFVPARIESFREGWLKIIPLADLDPGEYALVEVLDGGQFNSYAWDFGVDLHAPGDASPRKAEQASHEETSPSPPELKPR